MTIKVNTPTGIKDVRSIRMVVAANTIKWVRRIRRVEVGDVLQTIYTGFDAISASITPNPLVVSSAGASTVSGSATANVTGGSAPFTYSWTVVSHTGLIPTITGAATASPTFNQRILGVENSETAIFRVSITDATGQAITADLSAQFSN